MSDHPWLRLYSELPRDRKLRREKPETRWLWVVLLCMAGASPERGRLLIGTTPAFVDDIADEAALTPLQVRKGLDALVAAGMLERDVDGVWIITKWAARQYESDSSTSRVRAFRERQRNVSRNGHGKRCGIAPDTETDTESELSMVVRDGSRPTPPNAERSPSQLSEAKAALTKRATRGTE